TRAGARSLARRLRPALAPSKGRSIWRKPQSPSALLSIPSHPETIARRYSGALPRLSRCDRNRSAPARHSLRRRRLGKSDAWGLGWEVWCDGMEISQFTYFQQIGGIDCRPVSGEITYGLERLATYIQGVDSIFDLDFNSRGVRYGDVFLRTERENSAFNFEA